MVGVAQLVEHRIVTPGVVGSKPIVHPIFFKRQASAWRCCLQPLFRGRGGIGRHTRFRFWRRKVWEFESPRPHQHALSRVPTNWSKCPETPLIGGFLCLLNSRTFPDLASRRMAAGTNVGTKARMASLLGTTMRRRYGLDRREDTVSRLGVGSMRARSRCVWQSIFLAIRQVPLFVTAAAGDDFRCVSD